MNLVTGASKGIGLATVIQALKAGYAVAATSRNVDRLAAQVAQAAPDQQAQFLPLEMQFEATSIQAAVIMMSEALAAEVAPFGIQITAVGLSGVRTDFLDGRSMKRPAKRLPEYQVVAQTMTGLGQLNHHQSGDPVLVGQAIVKLAPMAHALRRLYLGNWSVAALQTKIEEVVNEVNQYLDLTQSIDHE